jgi:hypothetical protein
MGRNETNEANETKEQQEADMRRAMRQTSKAAEAGGRLASEEDDFGTVSSLLGSRPDAFSAPAKLALVSMRQFEAAC